MHPTYTVEDIFGTRSRIAVLRVLHGVSIPLNASQIAARVGLTRPAVSTVFGDFAAVGVVRSSSAGQANVHLLVRDNIYVKNLVDPLFEAEERVPEDLMEDLRAEFRDLAVSVVLFGSHARGEQNADSDVDVALVARDASAKEQLEWATADYTVAFRRRFGATFSPLIYDANEAAGLRQRAPALAESLDQDGILVSGIAVREWSDGQEE